MTTILVDSQASAEVLDLLLRDGYEITIAKDSEYTATAFLDGRVWVSDGQTLNHALTDLWVKVPSKEYQAQATRDNR